MVTYSATVVRRIVDAMDAVGETRLGLSEKTGIPRPTLNRSLDGHRPLNTDEIEAIALALGLDVFDLAHPRTAA